ncbi:uncharacterized protein CCOS01_03242 [Colletotrichum costaricense]|uniref:Uncharacterized protein n=1 Tax=Colletotrichum costaricense TaxID=1209916 RepID=A0AAI9Z4S0_9PEZI|nr:uncharacterized protein CCOS01_03242 [Colletotrichum costaricense]KAI3530843.1 hypothetical protein CSPX01_14577 [Colletotrichum filicis]KAK1534490.1 hypothetical protein CCOS01_03242 [Colletotrichum costaricense]
MATKKAQRPMSGTALRSSRPSLSKPSVRGPRTSRSAAHRTNPTNFDG